MNDFFLFCNETPDQVLPVQYDKEMFVKTSIVCGESMQLYFSKKLTTATWM